MSHKQSAFVLNISTAVIRPTCIYLKLLLDMQNMQQCKIILNMRQRDCCGGLYTLVLLDTCYTVVQIYMFRFPM